MYGPFWGEGFSNHLPMVQAALYNMGHSKEYIEEISDYFVDKWSLKPFEVSKTFNSYEEALGNRSMYQALVDYYKIEIEEKGIDVVVCEALNYLEKGLSSILYHGIIRLAFAIENGSVDEVVRALAFYACGFEAIDFEGRPVPITVLKAEFTRFVQMREGYFYMKGRIEDKERAIVDAVSELYMNTGSFVILHTITGFQALMTLKKYFNDFDDILNRFTISVERILLRISQNDYKLIKVDELKPYNKLFSLMNTTQNAHTVKLVYACYRLNEILPNDKLLVVANIKYNEKPIV
jgi:hypothetical protein